MRESEELGVRILSCLGVAFVLVGSGLRLGCKSTMKGSRRLEDRDGLVSSAAEEYFIPKARGRGRRRRGGEAEFLRSALGGCSAPRKKLIGYAIGVRMQDHLKMCFCFRQGYVGSFDTNNAKIRPCSTPFSLHSSL